MMVFLDNACLNSAIRASMSFFSPPKPSVACLTSGQQRVLIGSRAPDVLQKAAVQTNDDPHRCIEVWSQLAAWLACSVYTCWVCIFLSPLMLL